MRSVKCCLNPSFIIIAVAAVLSQSLTVTSVVVPKSNCYALDNFSRLLDFDSDLVIRFCKDVESRSQTGYVDFGRYDKYNYSVSGSGHVYLVQEFYNGDLLNCEHTFDKMGRTAQANKVAYAMSLMNPLAGPRIFEGFTVGFHPRSWEIVYNGLTQLGFEKSHRDFSFSTEQHHVTLYLTAIASRSNLVQKPVVKVFPENGPEVKLSGSGATGKPPTTLSPSTLLLDWRCIKAHNSPYKVKISIPVEGYEPIEFVLTKMCEYTQNQEEDATRGWAIFGIISCILMVSSTLFCRVGFIYKTQMGRQLGIDALPGMTILSACLETVSGAGQGYSRVEDVNTGSANEVSWERPSSAAQGTWTPSESKYGSV
ncbi:peroxidase 72-like [Hibiscus syriacus]|uniref:Peroxidase 72-like n=1 Tax=Hibiscus syriacus TaxID=106335 RepID=A0A6A3AR05_HIBSY|nr:peroxidase 72-like [Hibiscus syriacus]